MLQAMYNGVSAIGATQQDMDVIGNNIANVNTDGFKSGSVTFQDQLSQTLAGASQPNPTVGGKNPIQVGLGVSIGSIGVNQAQGGLLSTGTPTDLAIQGNGYFQVGNAQGGISYTRDGHFAVDSNGDLVSADTGNKVLGWTADPTTDIVNQTAAITPGSALAIPVGNLTSALATSTASFSGTLDSNLPINTPSAPSSFSSQLSVYDSLGNPHSITVTFTNNGPMAAGAGVPASQVGKDNWTWAASGGGAAAADGTTTPPTNTGTLFFNTDGTLDAADSTVGQVVVDNTNGSTATQAIVPDFSQVRQFGSPSGGSTTISSTQNGYAEGSLQSFSIDQNGVITGNFSNSQTRTLGQVAMAQFSNPAGLNRVGNNMFSPSANSGAAVTTTANSNGTGSLLSNYLEQSNVDLGTEFTNMIIAQRSFQANTKIVTTVDQMLDQLISMKQ